MLMKTNMTLMPNQHDSGPFRATPGNSGRFNMTLMEINVMLMPNQYDQTKLFEYPHGHVLKS
jgi:hypothetical protein